MMRAVMVFASRPRPFIHSVELQPRITLNSTSYSSKPGLSTSMVTMSPSSLLFVNESSMVYSFFGFRIRTSWAHVPPSPCTPFPPLSSTLSLLPGVFLPRGLFLAAHSMPFDPLSDEDRDPYEGTLIMSR